MFSTLFGSIGAAIFGDISIGGVSLASVGRALGRSTGSILDDAFADTKKIRKNILNPEDLDRIIQNSDNPDNIIPLIYGTVRVGGQILWVSPIQSKVNKSLLFSGKWGFMPTRAESSYVHSVSVAIGLCEGDIDRVTNIYANDRLISGDVVTRLYKGEGTQTLDPLIESFEGADYPPFRHTAYIVIEDVPIDLYNQRLPNFTFDVVKGYEPKIENDITSLCLIPASGEFVYATDAVKKDSASGSIYENVHTPSFESDFTVCVDNLQKNYPNLKHVSIVVGWFFDHTDPAQINILPAVETDNKTTSPLTWQVGDYDRQSAWQISQYNGSPAYGGTPSDDSVIRGIIKLHQAGYKVTFYPFLFGDIPPDNPEGLPAYPWRGRITPIGTESEQEADISRFFNDGGYKAMILHYVNLCRAINEAYPNAIDLFIIGSELKGLTRVKTNGTYPMITELKNLASEVRALLGTEVKITYAADWSEDGSFYAPDGALDFPLDDLWSDENIDYIAYDWYPPLTDWRDGSDHLDAALYENDRDPAYLQSRIEGGEGYDWYYDSDGGRDSQTRLDITDGAYNEPWIFRIKDIRNRWLNLHFPRDTSGIRSETPTSWIPQSKKIIFTEIGCPAVNKGANSPNLFPDPKSSENALPPYSNGQRDDFIQRAVIKAYLDYWQADTDMIDHERSAIWCVDARPYPIFPARSDIWSDSAIYATGHWIDGRGGSTTLKDIFTDISTRAAIQIEFDETANQVLDGFIVMRNLSAMNMLVDLADIFNLSLTNQNDLTHITNGGIGFADILGNAEGEFVEADGVYEFNEKNIVQLISGKKKIPSQSENFVKQSETHQVPDSLKTHYLAIDQAGAKDDFNVSFGDEHHTQILTRTLPITAFGDYLKPFMQAYLAKLRANEQSVTLVTHNQPIRAGQIVRYNNRLYKVTYLKHANYLMSLRLELSHDTELAYTSLPTVKRQQNNYALNEPELKTLTVNGQEYIGLTVYPPIGIYQLYRTPQDGSATEYIGEITPNMIYGVTDTDFFDRPAGVLDTEHDLWVILAQGQSLMDRTQADITAGFNQLAIYNANSDLWEVISFETATLIDPALNKYQLSNITRGLYGTESAMGSPVPAGAEIILFDNALIAIDEGFTHSLNPLPVEETPQIILTPPEPEPEPEPTGTPPLDAPITSTDTKAQHVYGIDRMVEGYAGNTLRVQRLSDNAQEDFGFDTATGIFDLDGVLSWSAGSDVNVVMVYDQKGINHLNVIGTATLIISGIVQRFGTDIDPTNNQLIRSSVNGGVGIDMAGNCHFQSVSQTNFDTTSGLEVTLFHSPNDRKVTSSAALIDQFGGNTDDETLFCLYQGSNRKFANIVGPGSSVDYVLMYDTPTVRTINSTGLPYKQFGQSIASYSANPATLDIYRYGQQDIANHNSAVITAISEGDYNQTTIVIGDTVSGLYPNMLFGGFILSQPYTATERAAIHFKLNAIGQQHQRINSNDLLALFDEIVLMKNINPVTGIVTGEKGKLTLNFTTTANAGGTPNWDFAYLHPTAGIQGVRSPTRNAANGFIATDNYYAETHTGSMLSVDLAEDTSNDLYMVFSQATGAAVQNNTTELSLGIGRDHNQWSARMQIAYSVADGDSLINNRFKADETPFGYDQANQAMGKYNRNIASVQFNYDETHDGHVWDQAFWENQSPTQPYLLDAPVIAPCADNMQYEGKKNKQFSVQFATFEKGENYNFTDPWITRKQYRLTSTNAIYMSDGTSPIGHRDGSIAINPYGAVVHSTPDAKIMTVQEASTITVRPYHGTRFAMGFAKHIWSKDEIEQIQVNLYKLLT